MFIPNSGLKFTQSLEFKTKSNEVSKFVNVKGESSFPKVNFNTTLISIDTTLPYMQSAMVPLTISNPNKSRIEIMVAELDEEYRNEIKMLHEFNECEKDEDVA